MDRIKIAIQKKGRLHEDTILMFKNAGFRFTKDSTGFVMPCENADFDLILLRDDDIPTVVASENGCELGIVGKNTWWEDVCEDNYHNASNLSGKVANFIENSSKILKELPFGKCKLSLAGNKKLSIEDLKGKKVATSYYYTLSDYWDKASSNFNFPLVTINLKGSVEIAPKLGIADAICDLVSSGMTLKENDLIEGETILESTAILIGHKNFDTTNKTYQRIIESIEDSTSAKNMKYIMFNCKEENLQKIMNIIDFVESPTVMNLAQEGMKAVHVMCREDDFWNVHVELKKSGATSILIMSVDKVI